MRYASLPIMTAWDVPDDSNEFTDKRNLVTGGSKGRAAAIANRLRGGRSLGLMTARIFPAGPRHDNFMEADVRRPASRLQEPIARLMEKGFPRIEKRKLPTAMLSLPRRIVCRQVH